VFNTWTLDVLEGRIQTIRSVINPDKLGHLGPVADAWAIAREANQTRRPQIDRKSWLRSRPKCLQASATKKYARGTRVHSWAGASSHPRFTVSDPGVPVPSQRQRSHTTVAFTLTVYGHIFDDGSRRSGRAP
jgi:integrase